MFFSENELLLDLLGVFKIERQKSKIESVPVRNYDTISIRLKGESTLFTKDSSYSLKRGDLLYIPQNALYRHVAEDETLVAIHFINYTKSPKAAVELVGADNYDEIERLVLECYDLWKEKKQGYKHICTSILYRVLYLMNRQFHYQNILSAGADKTLSSAVDYIHKNFRKAQIPISTLSKMAFVSETYFRKVFKQAFSLSPSQYIINLKLEYATQLLQSKLYTVAEVSDLSGFDDPKYFSKLFKKRYAISPLAYKNTPAEKLLK